MNLSLSLHVFVCTVHICECVGICHAIWEHMWGTCRQPHFPSVNHVDTGEDRTLWSEGGKAPEVVYAQASRLHLNPQDTSSVLEAIR